MKNAANGTDKVTDVAFYFIMGLMGIGLVGMIVYIISLYYN
jgi:preprotein translocase subunit Sss1